MELAVLTVATLPGNTKKVMKNDEILNLHPAINRPKTAKLTLSALS